MNRAHRHPRGRARRARAGISLIEIVVACTLLAVALTAITGVTVKLAKRNRETSYLEQRTATLYQEVNRAESMPYDSLTTYLKTDSVKAGLSWYVFTYTIDPDSTAYWSSSSNGSQVYKKITLVVTPRAAPTQTQTATVRRFKAPASNPLYDP